MALWGNCGLNPWIVSKEIKYIQTIGCKRFSYLSLWLFDRCELPLLVDVHLSGQSFSDSLVILRHKPSYQQSTTTQWEAFTLTMMNGPRKLNSISFNGRLMARVSEKNENDPSDVYWNSVKLCYRKYLIIQVLRKTWQNFSTQFANWESFISIPVWRQYSNFLSNQRIILLYHPSAVLKLSLPNFQ